jgi:ADP-heptose:LPS heptosyltransferase
MHTITLPEPVTISSTDTIKAGGYIAENLNGAQLIARCGDGTMTPLTETRPFDEKKDWNGKKILIVRAGGFGDLVNLTPVLREIKKRWPNAIIDVSSIGDYGTVLENLSFVDNVLKYPIPVEVANTYDAWIFFEKAIEKNPRAEKVHMTDLFAEIVGLTKTGAFSDWTDFKQPAYCVTGPEASWAQVQFPRKPGVRRLVVQVGTSAECRIYPMWYLEQVVNALAQKGFEIFLIDKPGTLSVQSTDKIKNLSGMGLTFRQSAAVLNTADVFLGSDSAFAHIAGALEIPAVALFGPFPWKLRTAYSPSITAIQGVGKCSPCFHHENPSKRGDRFPKHCPSKDKVLPGQQIDPQRPDMPLKTGYCQVLGGTELKSGGVTGGIEPKRVIAMIEKVAKKQPLEVVE